VVSLSLSQARIVPQRYGRDQENSDKPRAVKGLEDAVIEGEEDWRGDRRSARESRTRPENARDGCGELRYGVLGARQSAGSVCENHNL